MLYYKNVGFCPQKIQKKISRELREFRAWLNIQRKSKNLLMMP